MKNTKLVMFDLDGVLVDACELHYEALNKALSANGKPSISREDHESKYNGLPTKVKLNLLGYEDTLIKKIDSDKQNYTLELIEKCCAKRQEKIDLIDYLKNRGIVVGCVTNSIRKTTQKMLIQTGIYDKIDFCITNEDVCQAKPDPEGYLKGISFHKDIIDSIADQVVIVEDSPKGLQAARATGACVVQVKDPNDVHVGLFNSIVAKDVEKSQVSMMRGGWFVGAFEPTLENTKDFEVGYRSYKKGEEHDMHYHVVAKEINCVARGVVEVEGQLYKEGDIFIVHPFKAIKPIFHEDSSIVCVKIPSCSNDKYVLKDITL